MSKISEDIIRDLNGLSHDKSEFVQEMKAKKISLIRITNKRLLADAEKVIDEFIGNNKKVQFTLVYNSEIEISSIFKDLALERMKGKMNVDLFDVFDGNPDEVEDNVVMFLPLSSGFEFYVDDYLKQFDPSLDRDIVIVAPYYCPTTFDGLGDLKKEDMENIVFYKLFLVKSVTYENELYPAIVFDADFKFGLIDKYDPEGEEEAEEQSEEQVKSEEVSSIPPLETVTPTPEAPKEEVGDEVEEKPKRRTRRAENENESQTGGRAGRRRRQISNDDEDE